MERDICITVSISWHNAEIFLVASMTPEILIKSIKIRLVTIHIFCLTWILKTDVEISDSSLNFSLFHRICWFQPMRRDAVFAQCKQPVILCDGTLARQWVPSSSTEQHSSTGWLWGEVHVAGDSSVAPSYWTQRPHWKTDCYNLFWGQFEILAILRENESVLCN